MTQLRLGAVLDDKPAKVAVELSAATLRDLKDYAEVHARQTGVATPLAIEKLIGPMLEQFMASDRAFRRLRRQLPE
ncbi:MAG: DUF2274 domain-containing protein [Sphingomonas sp.]